MPKRASAKLPSDLFNARWLQKLLPVVVYDIAFCVISYSEYANTYIRVVIKV